MKWLMTGIAAAGMLVLAGCAESRGTRVNIDTDSGEAAVRENSYRLKGRIKIAKVTYGEDDGIRKATVTLESMMKRRQRIQARMVWLDEEGTAIDADGKPFRAYVIDGNDSVTFTGYAPNAKGVKAQVQVREDDTVE